MSVCPVYQATGLEALSPRGKLNLLEGASGSTTFTPRFREILSYCLLCGACSSACAVDLDIAGSIRNQRARLGDQEDGTKKLVFKYLFDSGLLSPVAKVGSVLQPFLRRVLSNRGFFRDSLRIVAQEWFPHLPFRSFHDESKIQNGSARIAYFTGCLTNYLFPDVGRSVTRILAHERKAISVPSLQKCCGLPAYSAGYEDVARSIAEANISAFLDADPECIVTACASCAWHLKVNYPKLLANDPVLSKRAIEFAGKIEDIASFFVHRMNLPDSLSKIKPIGPRVRVTYHDPCHFRFGRKITAEPRELIKSLTNVDFREFQGGSECCGNGGLFSINYYDLSHDILNKRIAGLQDSDADILVTGCMGCLIQWKAGVFENRLETKVMHLSEFLGDFIPPQILDQ